MSFKFSAIYIQMNSRLNGVSIESKNTRNGVSLLSFILILIFLQFTCSLFIFVFTIH